MKGKKLFLLVPVVFLLVLFGWAGGAWAGVAQVAAGSYHTVIIKDDGSLWAWGWEWDRDDRSTSPVPVRIGGDNDWKTVDAAGTKALKTDGSLWDLKGVVGIPVRIGMDTDWQTVTVSALLKTDGSLWAFDGTSNIPVRIGIDTDWQTVTSGYGHNVALKADGSLWAWGWNGYGQLGDGTTENKIAPVRIGTDTDWQAVAAEGYNTVALKTDSSLWAWGNNVFGQLGDGTTENKVKPVQIGADTDWLMAKVGWLSTVALKQDGSLWAWGRNKYGQLGDGTTTNKTNPVRIGTDNNWQNVVVSGAEHTVALKTDGSLWAWGKNDYGQIGNGTTGADKYSPALVNSDIDWKAVFAGSSQGYHSVALKADSSLWAWGKNDYGQIGNGTTTNKSSQVRIDNDTNWQTAAAGTGHTAALKNDGSLWAWGYNKYGQLGDGTTTNKTSPVQIGTDTNWQAVAAGDLNTFALKSDGSLWAWGANWYGQLGDGTMTDKNTPVRIGTDNDWRAVATGFLHAIALKNDGSLWAWGYNKYGQLGDGTTNDRLSPVQIGPDTDWQTVVTGSWHTLALKSDGSLWAWGYNEYGQLGDGTTTSKTSPVQVTRDGIWRAVSAGSWQTLALKMDGTLWAWGSNLSGKLGIGKGTAIVNSNPVQVGVDKDWLSVKTGGWHTLALKQDGSLWAWGDNEYGQLGDGTAWVESPVMIIGTTYTVTPSAGTGGSISPNSPQSVEHGNTASFEVTPRTGYVIDKVEGCGGSLNGSTYTTGAITADCAVTASFKSKIYTVTPSAGTGGSISPDSPQSVEHDKTADFTVTPDAGYLIETVEGCGGSLNGNVYTTGAITADCAVTATFVSSTTYTVTPRAGRHGSLSPSAPQQVRQGTAARFTVTPNAEYAIRYVSGCGGSLSGNVYTTGPITQDCSVTALFKRLPKHFVIPSAGRHGSISPRRPQRVLHGMTTSFTVTPRPGYAVRNVSGCGGSLSGDTYTTGAITRSCWVRASFMKEEDAPLMSR